MSTNTVTIDGAAVAVAVGDIIVRTGSVNREWSGFGSIFKTGTFQNVDPTIEPSWSPVTDANGGTNRPLSEGLMLLMNDNIRANGGKGYCYVLEPRCSTCILQPSQPAATVH